MNTPCSSFLVCNPFFCLKKMRAAPEQRETARTTRPTTKTENAICYDKAENGSTNGTGCPGDVASLEPHKFKGLLETLEHGIAYVLIFVYFS